ncbi:fumarate/nitrate reduction transcriptional regulator Fnr [Pseudomonas sp. SA3-5]|uniref:Fumarate/nitrate reduction transcriptional regulator Fnr n=1 Tax=Pseudomonas aestuarii TaxID=3018340 RepID=A0ABT4XDU0_9PSED|nr:fumarate/nitrate reduction transcriptional regulator Fnr [Pseudomonas aestuarii]MDA7086361.1 fumarate/nitrate reduction transcriptional regulator Fnr [Pseudomonas aestuarii]
MYANGRHSAFTSSLKFQMNCHDCSLSRLCLPGCLQNNEVDLLENIIKRNHPLHKGEHLFRAGEPMQQVYALRSGALKTYLLDPDGNEQITGFTLPGELVGLDAFGNSSFPSYAVALETSLVCTIPLADLEELAGHIPSLRKRLLATLSHELQEEQQHYSHNRESAERRLAIFLLNLSRRYSRRSLSATSFILSMSRSEIGNYLGLTTETVSRLFSRLRRQGLLEINGRELRLKHPAALNQLGRIEVRQLAV